jgi:hypothetical protein
MANILIQPPLNTILEEVSGEYLIRGHSYMIESISYAGNIIRYKGVLIENETNYFGMNISASLFMIYESHPNSNSRNGSATRFYSHFSRYYKSCKQQIADNQARRTYINNQTARMIDDITRQDVGKSIVYQFNSYP